MRISMQNNNPKFMGHNKPKVLWIDVNFGKNGQMIPCQWTPIYFQTHNLFFLFPHFSSVLLRFVLDFGSHCLLFIFSYIFLSSNRQTNTYSTMYKFNHLLKLFHFIPMCVEFCFFILFFLCFAFFRSFFLSILDWCAFFIVDFRR